MSCTGVMDTRGDLRSAARGERWGLRGDRRCPVAVGFSSSELCSRASAPLALLAAVRGRDDDGLRIPGNFARESFKDMFESSNCFKALLRLASRRFHSSWDSRSLSTSTASSRSSRSSCTP